MGQIPSLANLPFAGGDGIVTPSFASTIGLKGGPIYGTVAVVDTTVSPAAQNFRNQYDAIYGAANLNVYSAAAYDCANIMIQAIKTAMANGAKAPTNSSDSATAKTFRQAVINAIQNISWDGITGHQSFDSNGDTTNKVISLYQLAEVSGKPDWKYITAVTVS
jgi:branched-chain amino acid transport system substrate-binding protein